VPRIFEFCCVIGGGCVIVVGCVTVVSRVVVVVVVVGCDEHEAKLSIAAIPSRKINILIVEFSLLRVRCKSRIQMYFSRTFLPVRRQISVTLIRIEIGEVRILPILAKLISIRRAKARYFQGHDCRTAAGISEVEFNSRRFAKAEI